MLPLVLPDVDGVLNAFHWQADADSRAHGSPELRAQLWPVTFSPAVVGALRGWQEQGRAEVQWLTTWGHAAHETLQVLRDLPHLTESGRHDAVSAGQG